MTGIDIPITIPDNMPILTQTPQIYCSRKELRHMCEAFHELFKNELDEKVKAGEKSGINPTFNRGSR
jgi:hypothetical protein